MLDPRFGYHLIRSDESWGQTTVQEGEGRDLYDIETSVSCFHADLSYTEDIERNEDPDDRNRLFPDSKYPEAKNLRKLWVSKFVDCWREYRKTYFPEHAAADTEPEMPKTMLQLYGLGKGKVSARRTFNIPEEIVEYFAQPTLMSEDDPLAWWKANARRFPILSKMARDILAIAASSSEPERCFSLGRNVINYTQSSMSPDAIQGHVRVRANLRYNKQRNASEADEATKSVIELEQLVEKWSEETHS